MERNNIIIAAFILLLSISKYTYCQSIYGISGAIKTPNAYTVQSGDIQLGAAYGADYFNFSSVARDRQIENWSGFANIGFHSRIEAGLRIIGFPSVQVNTPTYQGAYVDRNVSAKFTIIKESSFLPQLSIGTQDAVGTRFFHGSYVVMSKKVPFAKEKMFITSTVGYGVVFPSTLLQVNDYKLKRFFGSFVFSPHKSILVMGEYDSRNSNIGMRYNIKERFFAQANYLNFQYLAFTLSVKFKL